MIIELIQRTAGASARRAQLITFRRDLGGSIMAHPRADCDLLFGLLALQTGLIDQGQLVAAFQAWTRDRSRALADHLSGRGDLDADDRAAVEALVARHLRKHGGSTDRSLAAIAAGRSTRESLAALGDPDVGHTLTQLGSGPDGNADRTASLCVGTSTSEGQRYRILRPHARGGLGAVFVALDQELHREVALKQILDQHADDPVSQKRFLLEAEVTGSLEHPGIVPVYGLGTYADGRPFYAMRFIRGDSLKEAIEHFHADPGLKKNPGRRSLELRKLLRRFVDVCNAIEYAHSRGVLHRDIKPANIIMGKHGETLVVDWGLAKALGRVEPGSDSGERTLVPPSASGSASTLPGSALGTPAYMSPEQSEGDLERVGARSDVYSLGATLYCLLTGKPPFEGDLAEVIVAVQKGQFPAPRQLEPALDRALEAVCKKAMALKPADRYGSPRALADEVERWMADEPVSAWHEPWTRTLIRWLTRHRVGVTAAAAAVLVALVGTGAVLGVQTTANAELKRANTHLELANARVTRANADLRAAGERERLRFDLAMEAIKLFHGEVSEDLLLKEKQFEDLRAKLLRGAAGFYGKLERLLEGQPDAQSRAELGRAYFELGDLTIAIGKAPDAVAVHRKALAVRRDLAARPGADGEAVLDVVRSLLAFGNCLGSTGADAAERASYEEALWLAEGLIAAGGGDEARFEMSLCLDRMSYHVAQQRPDEGLEMARRAQAISRDLVARNPSVTRYLERLANAQFAVGLRLSTAGKRAEGIAAYEESVSNYEKLASTQPERFRVQDSLGKLHNNIATELSDLGKLDEAVVARRAAVKIWRKAADRTPAATSLANNLAFGLDNVASDLAATGRAAEALGALAEARPILQKLADADLGDTSPKNLAKNYLVTGETLGRMGMRVAAKEAIEKGLSIAQMQADEHPKLTGIQGPLADCLRDAGWGLWKLSWTGEALAAFDRERAVRHRLGADRPGKDVARDSLANCETNSAAALVALYRLPEAGACCDRAIAIREELVKRQPANHRFQQNLAESLMRLGSVRAAAGNAAAAATLWRRAAAKFAAHPPGGESAIFRACCQGALAALAGMASAEVSAADGSAHAEEAMTILRREVAGGFRDVALLRVEPGLDALRSRDDFRQMMTDLVFPIEPFAWRVDADFRPMPARP
jgi:serine/threonine-protein kinase